MLHNYNSMVQSCEHIDHQEIGKFRGVWLHHETPVETTSATRCGLKKLREWWSEFTRISFVGTKCTTTLMVVQQNANNSLKIPKQKMLCITPKFCYWSLAYIVEDKISIRLETVFSCAPLRPFHLHSALWTIVCSCVWPALVPECGRMWAVVRLLSIQANMYTKCFLSWSEGEIFVYTSYSRSSIMAKVCNSRTTQSTSTISTIKGQKWLAQKITSFKHWNWRML